MPRVQTKIKSRDVGPEILDLLRRERTLSRQEILREMERVAERKGLLFRAQAVGYALGLLKSQGWLSNPRRGIWSVTTSGEAAQPTADEIHSLGRQLWGA